MLKQFDDGVDWGSNPHTSTKYTFAECIVDGGDLGSIHGIDEWSYRAQAPLSQEKN